MEILYILVPVAIAIIGLAVGIFFWAVKSGQYEDMEGPAYRILMDDDPLPPASSREREEGRPDDGAPR